MNYFSCKFGRGQLTCWLTFSVDHMPHPPHTCPLPCTPPAMHAPFHTHTHTHLAFPLPCIPSPPLPHTPPWTDRGMWKHYLPATLPDNNTRRLLEKKDRAEFFCTVFTTWFYQIPFDRQMKLSFYRLQIRRCRTGPGQSRDLCSSPFTQ